MRLTMLGRPGAGKGTQGELLAKRFGIPHISTGSMLREAIRSATPTGVLAASYIDKGNLVPDDVAMQVIRERLSQSDCKRGYILDGYPRTVAQAVSLDRALAEAGAELDAAVEIFITDEEAVLRIAHRWVCAECGATYFRRFPSGSAHTRCTVCGGPLTQRADDTVETARKRLAIYLDQTKPVVSYYEERGRLVSINGEQSIEQVFRDTLEALKRARGATGSGSSGVL